MVAILFGNTYYVRVTKEPHTQRKPRTVAFSISFCLIEMSHDQRNKNLIKIDGNDDEVDVEDNDGRR